MASSGHVPVTIVDLSPSTRGGVANGGEGPTRCWGGSRVYKEVPALKCVYTMIYAGGGNGCGPSTSNFSVNLNLGFVFVVVRGAFLLYRDWFCYVAK